MPKTLEQLRQQFGAIEGGESTYAGIEPADAPLLEVLAQDPEPWMAARAVFAASRIADPRARSLLTRSASDPREEVRVAVAASLKNVDPTFSNDLLLRLLGDAQLGVRKFAVESVTSAHSSAVHARVRDLEARDPASAIREGAKSKLQELRIVP